MHLILTIYVRNWRAVTKSTRVAAMEWAASRKLSDFAAGYSGKRSEWQGADIQSVEFIPNYASPMDYGEHLRDDAWALWSAFKAVIVLPNCEVDDAELQSEMEAAFGTRLHVKSRRLDSAADAPAVVPDE
jgi:hypothetical protein